MIAWKYSDAKLCGLLSELAQDANKYTRGKVSLVAGCSSYPGAAALAALASQRMGAGYTEVICAPKSVDAVRAVSPSLVVRSWKNLSPSDFPSMRAGHPSAYVLGPGFDASSGSCKKLAFTVLESACAPLVVDGGALAFLATKKGRNLVRERFESGLDTVVTPHAGEAARLAAPFGFPTDDAGELARLISLAYGVTALVKGPKSFISDGEIVAVMGEGTPALAKAGTGDVLAGMLGALLAQGLASFDACVLAATLHARAGRLAASELTERCVVAEDLPRYLPLVIREFEALRDRMGEQELGARYSTHG